MIIKSNKTRFSPNREGWVYFIHAQGTNKVKIGRSAKPIARQSQLQKQSPHHLVLLRSFYSLDSITDEIKLHERFASHRILGEWFDIFHQLEEFVEIEERGDEGCLNYSFSHTYGQIKAETLLFFQGLGAEPTEVLQVTIALFLSASYPSKMELFWYITQKMIPGFFDDASLDPTSFIVGYLHAAMFLISK